MGHSLAPVVLRWSTFYWAFLNTPMRAHRTEPSLCLHIRAVATVAIVMVLSGMATAEAQERHIVDVEWTLVGGVPPALESDLLRPLLFAAHEDQLYVFDYGDLALKAFGWDGVLRWGVGRRGRGPREFSNPTDLQVDARGNIWVLDPENQRATVVAPGGRVERLIPLPRPYNRVLPVDVDGFWAILDKSEEFGSYLDAQGKVKKHLILPDEVLAAELLAREARVAVSPDGSRAVVGFIYASTLMMLEGESGATLLAEGIEPVPFPGIVQWKRGELRFTRLDPEAVVATLSLDIHGNEVYAHFRGTSKEAGKVLDVYSITDGRYLRSYALPEKCLRIAVLSPNVVAALIHEPVPTIKVWQY